MTASFGTLRARVASAAIMATILIVFGKPAELAPEVATASKNDNYSITATSTRADSPISTPTIDPDVEPGFPVQVFGTAPGMYASGPGLHVLVGNVDGDPTLEIAVTGLANGPLYIFNSDGSAQAGWPFQYTTGAVYPALGEMDPSLPGLEIMANYFGGTWETINAFDSAGNLLPGWPQNSSSYISKPATFADIDGDGVDEVWVPQQSLYAYRANGTGLPGWSHGGPNSTPAIADLDGDGVPEIVTTGDSWTSALYAYRADGTLMPGFPVPIGTYRRSYPAIGDVDGDGVQEIVVGRYYDSPTVSFIIVSPTGEIERTLTTDSEWGEVTAPALADMDGDGYPEIIALDGGQLYVWYGDGRLFPGWPQRWNLASYHQAPVVGDIDGDGWPDIVMTHTRSGTQGEGSIRAYNRFGNLLPGFPKDISVSGDIVPAIADIDLDGRNELIVSGSNCCTWKDAVWAYDLHGAGPYGRVEWGQFMGGPKHQGTYVPPVCSTGEFIDVPEGHTFHSYVSCLATRGILGGYPNCTFRPNNGVTRGQLAKIVSNAAGFVEPPGAQIFTDILPGSTFYEFVQRLATREHISGYPCGVPSEPCDSQNRPYFRPNGSATRGQISKIVANAMGLNGPPGPQLFADVPPGSSFYEYVQRLAALGSMSGYPCGAPGEPCDSQNRPYFRPGNNATRGQTAKIVANTFFPNCSPLPPPTATAPPTASATPTQVSDKAR
jgi:hypothetical protein